MDRDTVFNIDIPFLELHGVTWNLTLSTIALIIMDLSDLQDLEWQLLLPQLGSGGASPDAIPSPVPSWTLTVLETKRGSAAQGPKVRTLRSQFISTGIGSEDRQTSPDIAVYDSR